MNYEKVKKILLDYGCIIDGGYVRFFSPWEQYREDFDKHKVELQNMMEPFGLKLDESEDNFSRFIKKFL